MRAAALLLFVISACGHTPKQSPGEFQERRLATIPEGLDVWVPPAFTPDGRHVAFVGSNDGGAWAFRGDWKSRRLDAI